MTEEEVLRKMDTFKDAIVHLKERVKELEADKAKLSEQKSSFEDYSSKVDGKLNEIEALLKDGQ